MGPDCLPFYKYIGPVSRVVVAEQDGDSAAATGGADSRHFDNGQMPTPSSTQQMVWCTGEREAIFLWALALTLLLAGPASALVQADMSAPEAPEGEPLQRLAWSLGGPAAWQAAAPGELELICPPVDSSVVYSYPEDTVVERSSCPFRILDGSDLMGSPYLLIDPNDPNAQAFVSLHGCATDKGANSWSRSGTDCTTGPISTTSNQVFTTFTSVNGGRDWKDQPHGTGGFGEHTTGTVDRLGRMYIGHLFSRGAGSTTDGESVYDYRVNLYKPQDWQNINYYSKELRNRAPGNEITSLSMTLVKPWTQVENLEQHNQTKDDVPPPSTEEDIGNSTVPRDQEDTNGDLVVASWHERAFDFTNTDTGKSSWIQMVWSDTSSHNDWTALLVDQLVGPCRHASNAEAWNGRIYVACSVDAGYDGRRGAKIGDVDIWAIDPNDDGGRKQFVSQAAVPDGELIMDINEHGMMALASYKPVGEEAPYAAARVTMNFAWYGRHWGGGGVAAGPFLHGAWNLDFREAKVTGLELTDDEAHPVAFLTYMERAMETGTPGADPNNPLASGDGALEYHKSISTYSPCGGLTALYDLQIGVARSPFDNSAVNNITGAFMDSQDGLAPALGPDGREVMYFAIGDHGLIQWGAIVGESGTGVCSVANPPPLFVVPPPVPAALTSATGVGTGIAVLMGAPMAAMFSYLVVAKRKAALAAVIKS